jgi:hypothetical protein
MMTELTENQLLSEIAYLRVTIAPDTRPNIRQASEERKWTVYILKIQYS